MDWQQAVVAVVFSVLGVACVLSIPIGAPGTWMLIAVAGVIEFFDAVVGGGPDAPTFGRSVLATCVALALVGEAIEAAAGAAGTHMGGGSRRGMVGAIVGGLLGALLLTVAVPVPLVGTMLGALAGTFGGAFIGEATGDRAIGTRRNLRAAFAATVGRLAGTLGKTAVGVVIWTLLVRAAFVS